MSKVNLRTLLQTIQNDGIVVKGIKSRIKLRETIEAIKCLVVDGDQKNEKTVVEKIKFGGWKILGNHSNLAHVSDDMGYPTSMEELEAMVADKRLEKYEIANNKEAYLKYLTQDGYKLETRNWGTYIGNDPDEADTLNSTFFMTRKAEKKSPAKYYRQAVQSTRQVMTIYLKDAYVKEMFFRGDFHDFNDFEQKMAILAGLGDGLEDHEPLSTYREQLKEIMKSGDPPRQKYAALATLVKKHFTYEAKRIPNPVWEGDKNKFQGPDNEISPAFHMLLIHMSCLDMSDTKFQEIEQEFKRVNNSFAPEKVSEKRPHLLQLIASQGQTEQVQIKEVQEQINLVEKCEEINDIEDFDDAVYDQLDAIDLDQVLAVRDRKFGDKISTRNRNAKRSYNKLNNFVNRSRGYTKNQNTRGGRGGYRGANRGSYRGSNNRYQGQNHQNGQKSQEFLDKYCKWCPDDASVPEGQKFHKIRDCPRNFGKNKTQVNQVGENLGELEAVAELTRQSIGL